MTTTVATYPTPTPADRMIGSQPSLPPDNLGDALTQIDMLRAALDATAKPTVDLVAELADARRTITYVVQQRDRADREVDRLRAGLLGAWDDANSLPAALTEIVGPSPQTVVCCGPSRFRQHITCAQRALALAGHVVIDYSVPLHGEPALSDEQVRNLTTRHDRAIDLADVIVVVNPGGYTGQSTKREVDLARSLGKRIVWMVEP